MTPPWLPGAGCDVMEIYKKACISLGTNQCAAICLQHLSVRPLGDCPEAACVWTDAAITAELKRRPNGPLAAT
jgi:hypothetical protein